MSAITVSRWVQGVLSVNCLVSILVIAATVFFRDGSSETNVPAGLFDAHDLIKDHIGKGTTEGPA